MFRSRTIPIPLVVNRQVIVYLYLDRSVPAIPLVAIMQFSQCERELSRLCERSVPTQHDSNPALARASSAAPLSFSTSFRKTPPGWRPSPVAAATAGRRMPTIYPYPYLYIALTCTHARAHAHHAHERTHARAHARTRAQASVPSLVSFLFLSSLLLSFPFLFFPFLTLLLPSFVSFLFPSFLHSPLPPSPVHPAEPSLL